MQANATQCSYFKYFFVHFHLQSLMKREPPDHTISKLIQEIEKMGCAIPSDFFVCQPAPTKVIHCLTYTICFNRTQFATGGFVMPDSKESGYKPQVFITYNEICFTFL